MHPIGRRPEHCEARQLPAVRTQDLMAAPPAAAVSAKKPPGHKNRAGLPTSVSQPALLTGSAMKVAPGSYGALNASPRRLLGNKYAVKKGPAKGGSLAPPAPGSGQVVEAGTQWRPMDGTGFVAVHAAARRGPVPVA